MARRIEAIFDGEDNAVVSLRNLINNGLVTSLKSIDSIGSIAHMRRFIGYIALFGVKKDRRINEDKGFEIRVMGVNNTWPLRLLIDASQNRFELLTVSAKSTSRFDEQSIRAVGMSITTADDEWGRVYQVVEEIVKVFIHEGISAFPRKGEGGFHEKFLEYCAEDLNVHLENTNPTELGCFAYMLESEPAGVRSKLKDVLPGLRLFEMAKTNGHEVLKLDEKGFGGWLTFCLYNIQQRENAIREGLK
ncbi:MAG: hypothetical protein Tsb002_38080 [Wenzhouxiangellaceae bacterium]